MEGIGSVVQCMPCMCEFDPQNWRKINAKTQKLISEFLPENTVKQCGRERSMH